MKEEDCAKRTFQRKYLYTCEYSDLEKAKACEHYFNTECTMFVSGDRCPFQREDNGGLAELLKLIGG